MDKDEVGHYVDYYDGNVGEDYTRGLAVINKLQAGERWIDAFYKIEKGLRHQEFKFENLDTFDEYFLSNLNYSFSEIGKKDENIEYSASDSYEYIGKSLVENAKSTEFLFHLLRVQDYILDVDDRDEKHINIIGKSITEDPNNPPVAIEAYNESGKKITPIDVKEYKDKGESTREYTFKIPVKAGKNEVRFVSDIKEINLTVNVGSISEPAKEPDGKKTNPKQPAPGETTISGYTIKGGILTGIAPFTPSTAFIEGFDGKYDVTVINQSNKEVASKYIYMGTGMTVKLTDGKTEYELKVAIKGDVTGTGGIDAGDARGILRHVAKLDELEGAYLAAADLKNDGNVDASNARMVLRYAAGLEKTL
ncbi:MAG: dockerin type I repeat-containing protein [Oscillospiraceae bacterium]|nr:dockerin type I repeat-containing protein [Oscillospiraceae bacterium]